MPRTGQDLADLITRVTQPHFRRALLTRGLARSLIWRAGKLPEGSPAFGSTLSSDLLVFGYALLETSLRLRDAQSFNEAAVAGFRCAGEAIEAVVRNGDPSPDAHGFHTLVAACANHLAHYSARAY